jgi:hypothetical protein
VRVIRYAHPASVKDKMNHSETCFSTEIVAAGAVFNSVLQDLLLLRSGQEPSLPSVQIDAALNAGNSGGPAFCNLQRGEVVGVTFCQRRHADSIGYIIPYVVVNHFLESYRRHGLFTGLCCMGMQVQRLENPSLRRFHKVCLRTAVVGLYSGVEAT